ncbi:AraC family transcriptional regulator [Nocardioides sp. NPDC127503]|uniref:AraC family transcriptional regulator n=1 Tax=Nocardioides sp. NPDC127503 TaxID=3154516 RepID=UPI00331B8C2B
MGQTASRIRRVTYIPPGPATGDIEVNTVGGIRERGGPREFLDSQRLEFDLLVRVESGNAVHTVDFTDVDLATGDVLWVRAGQVQRWGRIDDIEGRVVMFAPHAVADRTRDLIRASAVRARNHWPAADLDGSPIDAALRLLIDCAEHSAAERSQLRQASLGHALALLLAELALVEGRGTSPTVRPTHEAYGWFRDHIEDNFHHWHQVSQYADRLGYSARTLNRLARQNTGLSAKELIDERVVLEAKRQLSHGDASVAEVAALLGFDDPSNFSSYFRRRTGTTPAVFRSANRRPGE